MLWAPASIEGAAWSDYLRIGDHVLYPVMLAMLVLADWSYQAEASLWADQEQIRSLGPKTLLQQEQW